MKMLRQIILHIGVAAGLVMAASAANAGLVQTFSGGPGNDQNDCSGLFGQGFDNCKIPANIDPDESPVIIKFDFKDDGTLETPPQGETNPTIAAMFPTIDGSEFSFTGTDSSSGTWTYTPDDAADPIITFFVAKGGPAFNLFDDGGISFNPAIGAFGQYAAEWFTPTNPQNNQRYGLSHLTFYDTGRPPQISEPGLLGLLGLGLAGIAMVARRRRA